MSLFIIAYPKPDIQLYEKFICYFLRMVYNRTIFTKRGVFMNLENRKELRSTAKDRLDNAQNAAKIALIYAAVIVGATLLLNGFQFFLDSQISKTGGLSNMGMRSFLSTFQTMVPMALNFLLMCLGLGFTGTMLRVSRSQFTSPQGLKIGFARFWVLLRATLLQGVLYCVAAMAAYVISMQLFFLTPLSKGVISAVLPALQNANGDPMAVLSNPEVLNQMMGSMIPLYLLVGVILLGLCAPIFYRFRLVNYLILDNPSIGALKAMRTSSLYMRRNCMKFFKLDLSMWWYYAANVIAMLIAYGTNILVLLGVELPMSPMAASLTCFIIYMALSFLITAFLQPWVEVTHALAYDSLLPKTQPSGGVVLGNIFDLAKDQNYPM